MANPVGPDGQRLHAVTAWITAEERVHLDKVAAAMRRNGYKASRSAVLAALVAAFARGDVGKFGPVYLSRRPGRTNGARPRRIDSGS